MGCGDRGEGRGQSASALGHCCRTLGAGGREGARLAAQPGLEACLTSDPGAAVPCAVAAHIAEAHPCGVRGSGEARQRQGTARRRSSPCAELASGQVAGRARRRPRGGSGSAGPLTPTLAGRDHVDAVPVGPGRHRGTENEDAGAHHQRFESQCTPAGACTERAPTGPGKQAASSKKAASRGPGKLACIWRGPCRGPSGPRRPCRPSR